MRSASMSLYRMVDTAVAVLQLGGLCVDSQCQQLVTEADAEDRHIGLQQPLEVCYDLDILRRVAGAVGQHHAVVSCRLRPPALCMPEQP